MALLDDLLARLELPGLPSPTLTGLVTLHRAYLTHLPYENLEIQLGRARPLERTEIARRITRGDGRGGYCFELNGVLAELLEQAGFDVTLHAAVVGPRPEPAPVNHLALVVHVDGRRLLADAGFGEGFLEPVPLEPGRHDRGHLHWTVEDEPDGGWWLGQHRWGSAPGFRIHPRPVGYDAFAEHHERLSTSRDSPFVRTLVLQRPHADRIETLRSIVHTEVGPHVDTRRVLQDVTDLADTLRASFGITLAGDDLQRLWWQAEAQYEAFLRREAASPPDRPPGR